MNELKTNNDFDYSSLDKRTAENLREKEYALVGIHARYSNEVGKVLYEAREDLAKYYKGTFEKWYTGLGFKTTNVYSYINAYKYTLELEGSSKFEELEIFKRQPKSLQNEMSKPSAIPEVNQKVFEGDITAHKDYKEIEMHYQQQLKQKEEHIEQLEQSYNEQAQEVQRLKSKPAEVVEKPVVPEDYEHLKESNVMLSKELEKAEYEAQTVREAYDTLLKKRQEEDEGSRKYEELSRAIEEMQGRMSQGQKQIAAQKEVYELVRSVNKLIVETAPLTYLIDTESVLSNEYAQKPIKKIIDSLRDMANRLEENIQTKIIEGEIIND